MVQKLVRIVVIGAGYAGMLATTRLAGRIKREIHAGEVSITLINAAGVFVERLRLHQFAAHRLLPFRPIADILSGTGVTFLRGVVTRIDPARRTLAVQTDDGPQQIGYDNLLYTLGSTIDRDRVPGVREHAYVLTPSGPNSAVALRDLLPKLDAREGGGRLLVSGGGATGIEAAAEFAAAYPGLQVRLVTQGVFAAGFGTKIAAYMRQSLARLGVTILDHTTVTQVRAAEALTADGTLLPFDVCLWTGGFSVPRLAREAGLAVNERGQILMDPFMRSISHPEVYAAGDAAFPVEAPGVTAVRMAALTASIMGAHVADSLSAHIQHKTPKPLSFAYIGQGIALGPRNAIGFNNYPNDKPTPPYFTGRLGYEGREFFVRLLADLSTFERRWPGITFWPGKGRYAAFKRQGHTHAPRARHANP
jgi:NADH dehydrogenase